MARQPPLRDTSALPAGFELHIDHISYRGVNYAYGEEWCHPTDGGLIGEHNCIPVRRWFRTRWACVRCNRIFKVNVR